jgi:hypothetical protein
MQLTLEQSFATDLELLINQYITKGLDRGDAEEILFSAMDNMFDCDGSEDGPDEQKQWYDTSAELT